MTPATCCMRMNLRWLVSDMTAGWRKNAEMARWERGMTTKEIVTAGSLPASAATAKALDCLPAVSHQELSMGKKHERAYFVYIDKPAWPSTYRCRVVAERVGKQIVSLPMFYAMNESDVERTCAAMREVLR